ncbi:MAG: BatA domain-containing protein [Planctomycetota bacterium]
MDGFFGSPSMMWWAAGAGVPILIHLLSRRRFRRVPWAAMELLERAFKKTRKRLRMENLLLLLLRILAVLLIALALADPRLERGQLFGNAPRARVAVVLLDTSFSMDARDASDRPAFDRAREAAARIAGGLDENADAAAFVTLGSPAQLQLPVTRELGRVSTAIESTALTASSTDLLGGLKIAAGLLGDPALERDYPGARVVYCITDLQKSAFLGAGRRGADDDAAAVDAPDPGFERVLREIADARARLVLVDVGEISDERRRNVAVTSLEQAGRTLVRGIPARFECRVRNFGPLDAGGELEFSIDQEATFARSERIERIPGYETGTEEETEQAFGFEAVFDRAGWHYVAVRYRDDDLAVDNLRRFAFEVVDHVRVLAVAPPPTRDESAPASFFAARALDPSGGTRGDVAFRVREISAGELNGENLENYDMVVLADVADVSASRLRDLEAFVRGGGALLFFPGPSFERPGAVGVESGRVNELYFRDGEGLLPGRFLSIRGTDEFTENPWVLQFDTFDHPVTRYFEDPRVRPGITSMPVHKFAALSVDPNDDRVRVLARFRPANDEASTDLAPALVERRFGDGKVFLVTTSADRAWNLYGASPAFVPLMREIAYHLTRHGDHANLTVGAPLTEKFDASVRQVRVQRGDDAAADRATTLSPDKTSSELTLPKLDRAELIRMEVPAAGSAPAETRLFAVNVDPGESDLTRAADGWLTMHFGSELIEVVRDLDKLGDEAEGASRSSLWRTLLYVLLGVLVLETVLAWRIDRRKSFGEAA